MVSCPPAGKQSVARIRSAKALVGSSMCAQPIVHARLPRKAIDKVESRITMITAAFAEKPLEEEPIALDGEAL